MITRFYQFRLK